MESTSGRVQTAGLAVLVALFVLSLIGVWYEFNDIDTEWSCGTFADVYHRRR